jgi:hypothetical protein
MTIQVSIGQVKRDISGLVNNNKGMFEIDFRDECNPGTNIIGSVISEITSTSEDLLLYIQSLVWMFLAGGQIK